MAIQLEKTVTKQKQFFEIIKKNLEKGNTHTEMTVKSLMEDLKTDLRKMIK